MLRQSHGLVVFRPGRTGTHLGRERGSVLILNPICTTKVLMTLALLAFAEWDGTSGEMQKAIKLSQC